MVTRRTGYVSRTTNYLPDMTRNLKRPAASKGFAARVGTEAAPCWGTPIPLGTPTIPHPCRSQWRRPLSPSLPTSAQPGQATWLSSPQAILNMNQPPGQPGPDAQRPVAGIHRRRCSRVVSVFSGEIKIVFGGDQCLIAKSPRVSRV